MFTRHLRQDITYWPTTGSDGYGGFTFGTPVLVTGRWEEKQELFLNAAAEEELSNAIAYLNQDVSAGDFVALGDHTTTNDPGSLTSAYRIRNYSKITDLRALNALRKVWL